MVSKVFSCLADHTIIRACSVSETGISCHVIDASNFTVVKHLVVTCTGWSWIRKVSSKCESKRV